MTPMEARWKRAWEAAMAEAGYPGSRLHFNPPGTDHRWIWTTGADESHGSWQAGIRAFVLTDHFRAEAGHRRSIVVQEVFDGHRTPPHYYRPEGVRHVHSH